MNIFAPFKKSVDLRQIFASYSATNAPVTKSNKELYYGIVYSCVDAIATACANNEFGLYELDDRGEMDTVVQDHEAIRLLRKPNPHMTGEDLLYILSAHIDTHGAAYLYAVKSGNRKVQELWPLIPSRVKVVRGPNFIEGYLYQNEKGNDIPLDITEVIPIKRQNPFSLHDSISTIDMARHAQESDYHSIAWNKQFFANGAMPSGILSTDQQLTLEQYTTLKNEWRKNYEGTENAHKTAILHSGLNFSSVTPKQKDMDFLEQRRYSRDEVMAIFHVPKTIIAITDDVNRANAETSDYVFASRVVEPRLKLIFNKLNAFLLPTLGMNTKLKLWFESPVPENREYELLRKEKSVNKWLTINEVRAEDGYEPIEGGDDLYGDMNLLPIGTDVPVNDEANAEIEAGKETKGYHTMNKRDRELRRKRIIYLNKAEKAYKAKLKTHYRSLMSKLKGGRKELTKDMTASEMSHHLMPDMTNWKKLLVQITMDFGLEAMKQSLKDTGETYEMPYDFSLEHSGAIAWLKSEATEAADQVTNTMIEKVQSIIAFELQSGNTGLNKIREAVYDKLDEEEDYRVERIVRTELISAYNQGTLQEFKSSGLVEKMKWINADDDACETCRGNDEEVINLSDAFSSGDNAPPAHPNCRCLVVPVFD